MNKLKYNDYLISEKHINSETIEAFKGLYFLMWDEYVVYVGMSNSSIYNRVNGSHGENGHIDDKIFNNIRVIDMVGVEKDIILKEEFYFINLFNPYYNRLHKRNLYSSELPNSYIILSGESKNNFYDIITNINKERALKMSQYFF